VPNGLSSIVKECEANNPVHKVSGALYYSHGRYLQIIEGESRTIDRLMSNILKDTRHQDCLIQMDVQIKQRTFPSWQPSLVMNVNNDLYLRRFLARYSGLLKAMSVESRIAFNHFLKRKPQKKNDKIIHAQSRASLDVFGSHSIRLTELPSFAETELTPLMLNLCRLLKRQPHSVEQLVSEYGADKRDEIVALLRMLNQQGLLQFDDEESLDHGHASYSSDNKLSQRETGKL